MDVVLPISAAERTKETVPMIQTAFQVWFAEVKTVPKTSGSESGLTVASLSQMFSTQVSICFLNTI